MQKQEPLTIEMLLADSCSNSSDVEGFNEYAIELCCVTYWVTGRFVGGKLEIHSYRTL